MSTMSYRGYHARLSFEAEDGVFAGRIAGIKDRVIFEGESVSELKAAFENAVDDYLETCAARGREPQKPYSGRLMLRIDPEIHSRAATAAQVAGSSLNQWAEKVLSRAAEKEVSI